MILDISGISCGVSELTGLTNDPKQMLIDIGKEFYMEDSSFAFLTWSDVWGRNKRGNKLYHYIRRQFPNSNVIRTKKARNPSSGNQICVYVWKIPRGFKKWFNSYEVAEEDKTNGYYDGRNHHNYTGYGYLYPY